MHNYKALKSASKVSVQKVKVVDHAKVDEVKAAWAAKQAADLE